MHDSYDVIHFLWFAFEVEMYRNHLASIAMLGAHSRFVELLPPAAQAHLKIAASWDWVSSLSAILQSDESDICFDCHWGLGRQDDVFCNCLVLYCHFFQIFLISGISGPGVLDWVSITGQLRLKQPTNVRCHCKERSWRTEPSWPLTWTRTRPSKLTLVL